MRQEQDFQLLKPEGDPDMLSAYMANPELQGRTKTTSWQTPPDQQRVRMKSRGYIVFARGMNGRGIGHCWGSGGSQRRGRQVRLSAVAQLQECHNPISTQRLILCRNLAVRNINQHQIKPE
jgi:hypothetical protein